MFTGIIETTGIVQRIEAEGTNRQFWISSPISGELSVDQSLSHNGVCLTVEEVRDSMHRVTAVQETLKKTTLGEWTAGDQINLERCLALNGRLDGHFVQGHVDCRGLCTRMKDRRGSREYRFEYPRTFSQLLIEKGSICVDGISLTAFDVRKKSFAVAVIPYTLEHTNLRDLQPGKAVNLEFDLIGKYVARRRELISG